MPTTAEPNRQLKAAPIVSSDAVRVQMDQEVLVDHAPPEVKEWGRWRIPKLSFLPDGDLCLSFQLGRDHYIDQGDDAPFFRSRDQGRTWMRDRWPHPRFRGTGPTISRVNGGEFWCLPSVTGMEFDPERVPKPLDTAIGSWNFQIRRLADSPEDVQLWFRDLVALRWTPATGRWIEERVRWDHHGQLYFSLDDKNQKIDGMWGQKVYVESPIVPMGNELVHSDYWTLYETADGTAPIGWDSWLMVSGDNGRSWQRRSRLTTPTRGCMHGEPVIEATLDGALLGMVRVEGIPNHAMVMTRSEDRGHTWSEEQLVLSYGVLPRLLQLKNGVMVLTYGRAPGTWMSFSLDGGRSWTKPTALLDESEQLTNAWKCSCGYTSLVALGDDAFLVSYGDRNRALTRGEVCKSILTRRVQVSPR
jgi:hypothetical protein